MTSSNPLNATSTYEQITSLDLPAVSYLTPLGREVVCGGTVTLHGRHREQLDHVAELLNVLFAAGVASPLELAFRLELTAGYGHRQVGAGATSLSSSVFCENAATDMITAFTRAFRAAMPDRVAELVSQRIAQLASAPGTSPSGDRACPPEIAE